MSAGMTGDPCEVCGTTYDRCTQRIRSAHKPCCHTCGDTGTHNERVMKEVSLSVEAMAKVAALTKELNAVEQMEKVRGQLLDACGPGYEERTNEGLVQELAARARDRNIHEIRLLNQNLATARASTDAARYEVSRLRVERDRARHEETAAKREREEWRERYNTERAQRRCLPDELVPEDVVRMPSIPAEWQQVVSVEDDTAFFTRVVDGLYKNLWAGRGGQYYNDVELLQLTDVKRTK